MIVLGHDGDAIATELHRREVAARIVHNPNYQRGQFSSVLAGLHAVDRPGVDALLLTLVDVPLVSAATIRAVLDRFHTSSAPIVRPVRGDAHGHPVLIARSLFADLRAADPAEGAKPVVRRHASAAGDVLVEDAGAFLDIDTPAEYARMPAHRRQPEAQHFVSRLSLVSLLSRLLSRRVVAEYRSAKHFMRSVHRSVR